MLFEKIGRGDFTLLFCDNSNPLSLKRPFTCVDKLNSSFLVIQALLKSHKICKMLKKSSSLISCFSNFMKTFFNFFNFLANKDQNSAPSTDLVAGWKLAHLKALYLLYPEQNRRAPQLKKVSPGFGKILIFETLSVKFH